MNNKAKDMNLLQNHLKAKGFVYQGSEIYGGLANTWDYGPLGFLLKENIKKVWRKHFVQNQPNNFEIDAKILMNPSVWKASGHTESFSDPLIENKVNGKRYRIDKLIEEFSQGQVDTGKMTLAQMEQYVKKHIQVWEKEKTSWTNVKQFNLMFKTFQGTVENDATPVFLRPETAQGIFVNFKNIQRSMRLTLPFGVAQTGKSFRNEVTPGNFIFRTREFEQMELEVFCKPETEEHMFKKYVGICQGFVQDLGIRNSSVKVRNHPPEELAHYSVATCDIEFAFPFGFGELLGVACRGNFDLSRHSKFSNERLDYFDAETNQKIVPSVVEPSIGLDRLMFATLVDAFETDQKNDRILLKLDKKIAPYQLAVLPLNKKFHEAEAQRVFHNLFQKGYAVTYDQKGSIGKRYRRQDSIGTPFCITVIDETENDHKVTIRFRDSMKQEEILVADIPSFLGEQI